MWLGTVQHCLWNLKHLGSCCLVWFVVAVDDFLKMYQPIRISESKDWMLMEPYQCQLD